MNSTLQHVSGELHFWFAVIALISGTWVLATKKGTKKHRKIGMVYVVSMGMQLLTSFLTYELFGRFGMFHWMSLLATITLLCGILPLWFKKPRYTYRYWHLNFMYWSVISLYMALAAESFTRLPNTPFLSGVLYSSLLVYLLGVWFFLRHVKTWKNRFIINPPPPMDKP